MNIITQENRKRQAVVKLFMRKGKGFASRMYRVSLSSVKRWCVCPPTPSKFHPSPKEIPRRGPPGVPYLRYSTRKSGGLRRGGLGGGGPRGTGLSLRGGSLRGLLQRGESNRPVPPRSSPTVGILTGEGIQAYGALIPAGRQSLAAGAGASVVLCFGGALGQLFLFPKNSFQE